MAKVSTAQEPSMEEILASIRRIISEDEHGLGVPKSSEFKSPEFKSSELPALTPTLPSVPVSAADIDALFSARVAEFAGPLAPSHSRAESAPVEPAMEPRMLRTAPLMREPARAPEPSRAPDSSRAPEPAHASEAARLSEPARVAEPIRAPAHADLPKPAPVPPVPHVHELPAGEPLLSPLSDAIVHSAFGNLASAVGATHSQSLDDLVKDMLRPMLKAWLDTNLPPLVERLVRDEIERVSRSR